MTIRLIMGLRNPGPTYKQTRHNAGSWFAETLGHANQVQFTLDKARQGEVATLSLAEGACKLFLSSTFMNHSGRALRAISQFYQIPPQDILVAHDDLDLPPGRVKLKTGGGHGGHNGLRDIISQLGTNAFHRLRIGIGHPGHKDLVLDYVLGKPSPTDRLQIEEGIARALTIMPVLLSESIEKAMRSINEKLV